MALPVPVLLTASKRRRPIAPFRLASSAAGLLPGLLLMPFWGIHGAAPALPPGDTTMPFYATGAALSAAGDTLSGYGWAIAGAPFKRGRS